MDHDRRHYKAAKALVGLVLNIVKLFAVCLSSYEKLFQERKKCFWAIVIKWPNLVFSLVKSKVKTSLIHI